MRKCYVKPVNIDKLTRPYYTCLALWFIGSTSTVSIFFPLPNSCSICKKKQNRHFIVPRNDFTLLEVTHGHLAMLIWKGWGGVGGVCGVGEL